MIFAWKQRRGNRRSSGKNGISERNCEMELTIPTHFRCPISLDLMKDPVTLSTGITYDRESIEKWIDAGNQTCPVTSQALRSFDQIPNHSIRKMIQDWCVENKSFGIERVPTPRIPIAPYEVLEISSKITAATECGDEKKCQELVGKIKTLARESERNKKCIAENGVGYVLSATFESFAGDSTEKNEELLKKILSVLTWMFPLGEEGQSKIGSAKSLRSIAWFLNGEDLSARQPAVIVLKNLLSNSCDQHFADGLIQIEIVPEALFKIIKVPICPTATIASLMVINHMLSCATSDAIVSKFLDMGLICLLLELLLDGEKSTSEKALGVLDRVCNWQEGRENACNNALTLPVLVKKILRVSVMATEFSVSILWKLCNDEDENLVIEAMEIGAFQKLLVVLQVGCGERTKEKTTELLKLMHPYKDRVGCFDASTGFIHLKRPF